MKATGIIRRIDELGRVVIPKEIRKTMRLFEGEQVELFVNENEVVLKKYSETQTIADTIKNIAELVYEKLNKPIAICDRQNIIVALGNNYLVGKELTHQAFNYFEDRRTKILKGKDTILFAKGDYSESNEQLFVPLISCGDLFGGIILFDKEITQSDVTLCEFCANYLSHSLN